MPDASISAITNFLFMMLLLRSTVPVGLFSSRQRPMGGRRYFFRDR